MSVQLQNLSDHQIHLGGGGGDRYTAEVPSAPPSTGGGVALLVDQRETLLNQLRDVNQSISASGGETEDDPPLYDQAIFVQK